MSERNHSPKLCENFPSTFPVPSGYRLLVVLEKPKETTKGGIILTETAKDDQLHQALTATVIGMGPMAYTRSDMAPHGKWCEIGDRVMFGRYAGSRFQIKDDNGDSHELRFLNDDEVYGVINPGVEIKHPF